MSIGLKEKAEAFFGIFYGCDKCGSVFAGKENCDKHEEKCGINDETTDTY